MRLGLAIALLIGACQRPAPRAITPPRPGISIAIYQPEAESRFAIIDDRRWVELGATGQLVFDALDAGAELASLVIEPLAGDRALAIGTCTRATIDHVDADHVDADHATADHDADHAAADHAADRSVDLSAPRGAGGVEAEAEEPGIVDAAVRPVGVARLAVIPQVSCAATGPRGRYLVRIVYVTPALGFRARHELAMTSPDRATLTSRFAIATPAWNTRAEVTLFDGAPGAKRAPREIARGTITLDGSIAIIARPSRELPARLRRIYDGAVHLEGVPPSEPRWGSESRTDVWLWAELDGSLPAGEVFVRLALPDEPLREQHIAPHARRDRRGQIRLPLWIDPALRGGRERVSDASDLATIDRFVLAVANLGDAAREVWIEEPVRPFRQPELVSVWPKSAVKPEIANELVRVKLVVAAGAIERLGYTVTYTR